MVCLRHGFYKGTQSPADRRRGRACPARKPRAMPGELREGQAPPLRIANQEMRQCFGPAFFIFHSSFFIVFSPRPRLPPSRWPQGQWCAASGTDCIRGVFSLYKHPFLVYDYYRTYVLLLQHVFCKKKGGVAAWQHLTYLTSHFQGKHKTFFE